MKKKTPRFGRLTSPFSSMRKFFVPGDKSKSLAQVKSCYEQRLMLEALECRTTPAFFAPIFVGGVFTLESDDLTAEVVEISYDDANDEFVFDFTGSIAPPAGQGDFTSLDGNIGRLSAAAANGANGGTGMTGIAVIGGSNNTLVLTVSDLTGADTDVPTFTNVVGTGGQVADQFIAVDQANGAIAMNFVGNDGDDTIIGGAGDDTLDGGLGGDFITGGLGDDSLVGGGGLDVVIESGGSFTLTDTSLVGTATGNDTLDGFGRASLTGSSGNDSFDVSAFSGTTTLSGLDGNDTFVSGQGNDSIDGGAGTDRIVATGFNLALTDVALFGSSTGDDTLSSIEQASLTGTAGNDLINASSFSGSATIAGLDGADTLIGGSGADSIVGGAGDDSILGADGADTINGGAGNDIIDAGQGNDLIVWEPNGGNDTIDGENGADTVSVTGDTVAEDFSFTANGTRLELVNNGAGPFTLDIGTTEAVSLNAGDGDDTLTVNDLDGVTSLTSVSLSGGEGSDSFSVVSSTVAFTVDGGNPTVGTGDSLAFDAQGQAYSDSGSVLQAGSDGAVTYSGLEELSIQNFDTDATVTIGGTNAADSILIDAVNGFYQVNGGPQVSLTGITSLEINGGAGDDTVTIMNPAGSVLEANITINGGDGADMLILDGGGSGDFTTTYSVGPLNPTDGTLVSTDGNVTQTINFTGLEPIVDSMLGDLVVNGTDDANTIEITDGANGGVQIAIDGFEPIEFTMRTNVTVTGGDGAAGDDQGDAITLNFTNKPINFASLTINADEGDDSIIALAVPAGIAYTLDGGADGNDTIDASVVATVPFTIIGGLGDDSLLGSGADDSIEGGAGNDTIVGGLGADTMVGGNDDDLIIWNNGDGSDSIDGGDGTDTVQVNGDDAGNETFTVTANGTRFEVTRTSAVTFTLDIGTTESLDLNVRGGDDDVQIGDLSGVTELTSLDVDLGMGDDTLDASAQVNTDISLTVVGGDGTDSIVGSSNNDSLDGGAGNDTIVGGPGADTMIGGLGDDLIIWNNGDGSDSIDGGDGTDTVQVNGDAAGSETYTVTANGTRFNVTRTSAVTFTLDIGATENLDLNVQGGNDSVQIGDLTGVTGLTALDVDLGTGDDTLDASAQANAAIGLTVLGGDGDDSIVGSPNNDSLDGGAGNDTIVGGQGADTMVGGNNNDLLIWNNGDGSDSIDGGAGTDTVQVNGDDAGDETFTVTANGTRFNVTRTSAVTFTLDIGTTESLDLNVQGGNDSVQIGNLTGVTDLTGLDVDLGTGDDTLDASAQANTAIGLTVLGGDGADSIVGGSGNDSLDGGAGNDTIVGGPGADTMVGGANDDLIIWNDGDGSDSINGGDGTDTVQVNGNDGGDETFTITANGTRFNVTRTSVVTFTLDIGATENLDLNVQGGNDNVQIGNLTGVTDLTALDVDLGTGNDTLDASAQVNTAIGLTVLGGDGDDSIVGSLNNDSLVGGDGDDTILGDGGNDTITGNAGSDSLLGQAGNDIIDGGTGADNIDGGLGDDLLNAGDDSTLIGMAGDTIVGGDGMDTISGNVGNDSLLGNAGNDTIIGGDGNDTILGGDGDDAITGDGGDDSILGEAGNDTITGGDGNDTILGGDGDDVITGDAGDDSITGDGGNDSLVGGDGDDTALGGADNDTITGDLGNDMLHGGPGLDRLVESGGSFVLSNTQLIGSATGMDTLSGFEQAVLTGSAGNDSFDATGFSGGTVTLLGGAGDDTFAGSPNNDLIDGGSGTNRVIAAGGGFALTDGSLAGATVGTDILAFIQEASLTGGAGNDVIDASGFSGLATLSGGAGNDNIIGGSGRDLILGDDGNDTLTGGLSSDTLIGGGGIDTFMAVDNIADFLFVDDVEIPFLIANVNFDPNLDVINGQTIGATNVGQNSAKEGPDVFGGQPLSAVLSFINNFYMDMIGRQAKLPVPGQPGITEELYWSILFVNQSAATTANFLRAIIFGSQNPAALPTPLRELVEPFQNVSYSMLTAPAYLSPSAVVNLYMERFFGPAETQPAALRAVALQVAESGGTAMQIIETILAGLPNAPAFDYLIASAKEAPAVIGSVMSSVNFEAIFEDQTIGFNETLELPLAIAAGHRHIDYSINVQSEAFFIKNTLGLGTQTGSYSFDAFGLQEKWLISSNGEKFFILPTGHIHLYLGAGPITNNVYVMTVDPSYYHDPSLIFNAQANAATASVTDGILTVDPVQDFKGNLIVLIASSDGLVARNDMMKVSVINEAPTIAQIESQEVDHGGTLVLPVVVDDADDTNLTVTATVSNRLASLKDLLGILNGDLYFNYNGALEKWFESTTGAYFVLPNGNLYRYRGTGDISNSDFVATVGVEVYNDPSLLYAADSSQIADIQISNDNLIIVTNISFEGPFTVNVTVNDGGKASSQTFTINVTNNAPTLEPIDDVTTHFGTTVPLDAMDLDGDDLTFSAKIVNSLADLKEELGLVPGNVFFNYFGIQEKWVFSASGTAYFILPGGNLYKYPGVGSIFNSQFLRNVGADVYADPTLLTQALPQAELEFDDANLLIVPANGFVGTFTVEVTVSDGAAQATQTFTVTITNNAPILAPIDDEVTHGNTTVTLDALDADGDSPTFSAKILGSLSNLKEELGLVPGNDFFNFNGLQEKWIFSTTGTAYFILPTGVLYEYLGTGSIFNSKPLLNVGQNVYNDPTLLTMAQPEVELDFAGTQLLINPTDGFVGSVVIEVTVSDGFAQTTQTFTLTVTNTAPVLEPIDDLLTHGDASVPLNATDPDSDPLTLSAKIVNSLSALKEELGLVPGNDFFNFNGLQEKWVFSTTGTAYFILPGGMLYEYLGTGSIFNSKPLLNVGQNVYNDPTLLTMAQPEAELQVVGSLLLINPADGFAGTFMVEVTASDGDTQSTQTFTVTVTNNAPVLDPIDDQVTHGDATVPLNATDPDSDPLTFTAKIVDSLSALKNELGIAPGNDFFNLNGLQEKWFTSISGTAYFILPGGNFYQYLGTGSIFNSRFLFNLGQDVYNDPTLLTMAQPEAELEIQGGNLIVHTDPQFTGTFTVEVTVSDGIAEQTQSFTVTVTNQAPTLEPIDDQEIDGDTTLTLVGDDLDGDTFTFTATIINNYFEVKSQLGIYPNNVFFNFNGIQEKWFFSVSGATYFVLPGGNFYQYLGIGDISNSILLFNIGQDVYDNPSLLFDAQPSSAIATLQVVGNQLTIEPADDFLGSFTVSVTVSDGKAEQTQTFTVTVVDTLSGDNTAHDAHLGGGGGDSSGDLTIDEVMSEMDEEEVLAMLAMGDDFAV